MNSKHKKIKIPRLLHELYGEETSKLDFIMINIAGIIGGFSVFFLIQNQGLDWLKIGLIVLLGIDIFGGVVANFTNSVKQYYSNNPKLRYSFILLHLLQPAILCFVFPKSTLLTIVVALFVVFSMLALEVCRNWIGQKTISAFLFVCTMVVIFFANNSNPTINLILVLFCTKLILGFSQT